MADGFTIYHNPRCTTSRKTLELALNNLASALKGSMTSAAIG